MSLKAMNIFKIAGSHAVLCLSLAAVDASGCGVVHYLENKSNGVEVTANTCRSNDGIAVGSVFHLMPGARLWVKSLLTNSTEKSFQAICQNRSANAITIGVDSTDIPWIRPRQLSHCSDWSDNKMSCDSITGEQQALFCVLAAIEPARSMAASEVERTTSVTLRGLPLQKTPEIAGAAQSTTEFETDRLLAAMRPETELCRSLYQTDYPVKIDWTLDTNGRVTDIKTSGDSPDKEKVMNDAEIRYTDCVVDVVNYFPYPKPPRLVFLSARF